MSATTGTTAAETLGTFKEPDLLGAFEKLFGPTDWSTVPPVPPLEGPSAGQYADLRDGADDRTLQARADSHTVDTFGGGR